jgi:hypothetical protein
MKRFHATVRRRGSRFAALAALALASAVAGAAHAADLGLNPYRFFLVYTVKNQTAPVYQVLSATGASSFNTQDTPMLLPCGVQNFGGQLQVVSGGPDDVYPRVTVELRKPDKSLTVSHGYYGNVTFDHLDMNLNPIPAGTVADAGFTPVSKISPFKGWLYQPKDLPENTPVKMELGLTQFSDPQYTQGVNDPNPTNDALDMWIMRVCK